ncbi:MAG: hypothetical protein QNJ29_01275 [Rhizobiaceae bacterium]|nr:hypothetical protein [Rhizobiaceae bacterium]
MERVLSNKIEAVLLYEEFAVLGPNVWHRLINDFSAKSGVSFDVTQNVKTPEFFHFLSDDMTVEVDYVSEPVVETAFERALASKFTRSTFPDAAKAVSSHRGYVHLVVTNGKIDPPDPFINEEPPQPLPYSAEGFDFAVDLLRWLATCQISSGEPMGVYWAQCDKLLGSNDFLKHAINFKDPSLLIHPMSSSRINSETGYKEYRLQTFGAECLIGSEIKIDYVPIPNEELIACVEHLIGITHATGLMVPENHVFGRSENEEIRVNHIMEDGVPLVELVFELSDEHGISKPEEEEQDALEEFDLDDPAERAMFERIKLKQEQETNPSEDMEVSEFKDALHDEQSWRGVKKKIDMASLRSLAKGAVDQSQEGVLSDDAAMTDVDAPEQQKRLLKKVGGLFSRK